MGQITPSDTQKRAIDKIKHWFKNESDERQKQRSRQYDPIQDPSQVLLHPLRSDSGYGSTVLPDVLGDLHRVQRHLSVEIRKEYDQKRVGKLIRHTRRAEERSHPLQPRHPAAQTLGDLDRHRQDRRGKDHASIILGNIQSELIQRIIVPYTTQQYAAHDVVRAKKGKHMLNLYRDLMIWQRN